MQIATKLRYDNFVDCFAVLKWQNQTQAAKDAGFKPSRARQTASDLVTYRYIIDAIAKKKAAMAEIYEASIEQSVIEYNEARALAMAINQPAAAVSAIRWRDGLFGFQEGDKNQEQVVIIIGPKQDSNVKSVDSKELDDGKI